MVVESVKFPRRRSAEMVEAGAEKVRADSAVAVQPPQVSHHMLFA